ncbi:hypothetical protein [Hyalangium sp.]|uniref:hypothetical protein n=1 Tax=Hyalangium sp. TaxID=2028555 RepID=UPI002D5B873A|nr:hypothetical protein [Hyalangium sp.]HYH99290.1 hypothetical protein [Hyalangium sp.]
MNELLEVLRFQAPKFGAELAQTAYQRGLAVTREDGTTLPIPITATPVILDAAEIRRRSELTATLSSATLKMADAVLNGSTADVLLGALSPLERSIVERTWRHVSRLATTRVDFFVNTANQPRALEINTTIPAMQGYSDIAARTFLEVVARHFGYPEKAIHALLTLNGSNALALYRALLDGYAIERKGQQPNTVALLCRRNDAQITELRYLAERFREFGADADIVHPDEVSGEEAFTVNGKKYDLVYLHLFVQRLEETPSPWLEDFLATVPGKKAVFFNPPTAQMEVKSTFALLSQAVADPELAEGVGLSADELAAIRAHVPWTRRFRRGPTIGPGGEKLDELVAAVAAEPRHFALKRSWGYGGKAIFLGDSVGTVPYNERVQAIYGAPLSWPELCERAVADTTGGGYVVQELVETQPEEHFVCTETGALPTSFYVDYSAYASVGLAKQPAWGGVCRGSMSEIVNILAGGGVVPLITTEVAQKLLMAWKAI